MKEPTISYPPGKISEVFNKIPISDLNSTVKTGIKIAELRSKSQLKEVTIRNIFPFPQLKNIIGKVIVVPGNGKPGKHLEIIIIPAIRIG
jgi:lambda repressor-like predicted transcriptional regulator